MYIVYIAYDNNVLVVYSGCITNIVLFTTQVQNTVHT